MYIIIKLLSILFIAVCIIVYESATVDYPGHLNRKNPHAVKELNFQLYVLRVSGFLPNANHSDGADEMKCLEYQVYQ